MPHLSENYRENVEMMKSLLRVDESFDLIGRTLSVGRDELTLFYIDGFVKDGEMQRIMQYFFSLDGLPKGKDAAERFISGHVPYVEVESSESVDLLVQMVLSGATVALGSTFGAQAVIIDARTYPARNTDEPPSDRVLRGAHDGFVETLIFNTALLRRRLRDPRLTMKYMSVGSRSKTDIAVCYLEGKADPEYLASVIQRIEDISTETLAMGLQSLEEMLLPRRWFNPFPKSRRLERPDAAAASVAEGSILIICDTSPQVLVLPTTLFDFFQETDDYYMPPLTGSYLRILRQLILILSFALTPTWYLCLMYSDILPSGLSFIIPTETGALPIFLQLLLVEIAVDGLKLASMNTPDVLANSLSVIGALILGEFAVGIGWLSESVIFYMAVVTIAAFSQQNYELGYALKFLRIITLTLTALVGWFGYLLGVLLLLLCLFTNRTMSGKYGYLYPLIPFNGAAFLRHMIRLPKARVEKKKEKSKEKERKS